MAINHYVNQSISSYKKRELPDVDSPKRITAV